MIYGYARCSTSESKQDIDRQIRELKELGVKRENLFDEYESGTKTDREKLQALLNKVEPGDTIVTLEVSRITRSTQQLCEIINFAKEKQIKLVLGDFVMDCTKELDPITEGMLKMMGVFAELERAMIVQRVKSGMANAAAKGKVIGRPTTTADKIPQTFLRYYTQYTGGQINKSELAKLSGLSHPTVYKYIKMLNQK